MNHPDWSIFWFNLFSSTVTTLTDVTLVGLLQAGGRVSRGKLLRCEFHQSEFAMLTADTPVSVNLPLAKRRFYFSQNPSWKYSPFFQLEGATTEDNCPPTLLHKCSWWSFIFQPWGTFLPLCKHPWICPQICAQNAISSTNQSFAIDSQHTNTHVFFHSGYNFWTSNFPVLEACIYFNKSFQLNIFSFCRYEVSITTWGKLLLLSLSAEIELPPTCSMETAESSFYTVNGTCLIGTSLSHYKFSCKMKE